MFKLQKEPTFWADVTVVSPTDEGPVESTFKARFKVRPASVVETIDTFAPGGELLAFLRETVIDLDDIADDIGQVIKFSPELLDQVLDHFGARNALWNTYIAEVTRARVGN